MPAATLTREPAFLPVDQQDFIALKSTPANAHTQSHLPPHTRYHISNDLPDRKAYIDRTDGALSTPLSTSVDDHSKFSSSFPLFSNHYKDDNDMSTSHVEPVDNSSLQNLWNLLQPHNRHSMTDTLKFILNCFMWYAASSLTNNIGKQILNVFKFPVTLTIVQFALVSFWCYTMAAALKVTRIRSPTTEIARTIVPLAIFLIVGHVFSSVAISRVPVSLVHTIKALAPLFTVLFYRFIFQVRYTSNVYISLLPLTFGVILACTFTFSNSFVGLTCAFGSCLVFVTQNIFSKKLLFKESKLGDLNPNKLDKLNVLFYSSLISCVLMIPLWLYSDGSGLWAWHSSSTTEISASHLAVSFFLNGTMNFAQNWFAFTTLSMTSPVTYSILSLVKRIFVIVMSILWFGQQVTMAQSFGILLTFVGLWMYQNAKRDVDRGESKACEKNMDVLPMSGLPPTHDSPMKRTFSTAKNWRIPGSNFIRETKQL
ncbi:triose-phosphate transporter family-domain-containing protein [Radiomyces spectabilis]|uniref:triose-phosphate transporter family-domain-containing protein n=1 Tax=Radiomyces spectabilis TaxID=64574 RepID=UPI00221E6FB1|nr:triose-phosphate transporter family-domain-containing protein [Radiomyces spectabilis]KAI8384356.1 triose-phosphate transporter family-domain-containing protein [Radiomyces spectabilis]